MKDKVQSVAPFVDLATKFVGQVRRSFEGSGPRPVFGVKMVRKQWVLGKFLRLDTDIPPQVFYPIPKVEAFMSMTFQRKVNAMLRVDPIVLTGIADMRFKIKDGQYAKILNVHWKVEVYKLRKLEMNDKGVIAITQFDARSK